MKSLSAIRYLSLIALLLISQVGRAYVTVSMPQDCGMDMSMLPETVSEISSAHHPMQMNADTVADANSENMDCCDMDLTNDSLSTCCEGQCECSSSTSPLVFVFNLKHHITPKYRPQNAEMLNVTAVHIPFLQQPKRPPIRNFS